MKMMLHPNATFWFANVVGVAVSGYLVKFAGPRQLGRRGGDGSSVTLKPPDLRIGGVFAYLRGVNKLLGGTPPETEKGFHLSPPKSVEARLPFTIRISD
jgi:hypothetical protein